MSASHRHTCILVCVCVCVCVCVYLCVCVCVSDLSTHEPQLSPISGRHRPYTLGVHYPRKKAAMSAEKTKYSRNTCACERVSVNEWTATFVTVYICGRECVWVRGPQRGAHIHTVTKVALVCVGAWTSERRGRTGEPERWRRRARNRPS